MIIHQTTLANSILASEYKIEIAYEDFNKSQAIINELDVSILGQPHINNKIKIITIYPIASFFECEYNPLPTTVHRLLKDYRPKVLRIPDFNNSLQLYQAATGEKASIKIVGDKYSTLRGALLLSYIQSVELTLRRAYIEEYGADEVSRPSGYRKKLPDHRINQFEIFEIIYAELSRPASEKFFLEKTGRKTTEELLYARSLTKMDELGIPLSQNELKKFREVRNAVAHFRVVTKSDTVEILRIAEKIELFSIKRALVHR